VSRRTLEHLLKPDVRAAIVDAAYYFCETPTCDIVYFSDRPLHFFGREDLTVRVGIKESEPPIPVCYCFGFTEQDIVEDVARDAGGRIVQEITARVKAGLCACEITNPSGRCCLGNVRRVMRKAREGRPAGRAHAPGRRPSLEGSERGHSGHKGLEGQRHHL
jgi:hypothetical protein